VLVYLADPGALSPKDRDLFPLRERQIAPDNSAGLTDGMPPP
jgi:hypothetical protein